MKNTLSYLVFAVVASTSSLAFGPAVEDPCATIACADGKVCQLDVQEICNCLAEEPGNGEDPLPCQCDPVQPTAVCVPRTTATVSVRRRL